MITQPNQIQSTKGLYQTRTIHAVGETAALIFTAGSSLPHRAPRSLLEGTRTLSIHFYQLAREGISADHAYATAALLVLAIAFINLGSSFAMHRFMRRYG